MSEHLSADVEHIEELRTPEEQLETAIGTIRKYAETIAQLKFYTLDEARECMDQFTQESSDVLSAIHGRAEIELSMRGQGVFVPNVSFARVSSHDGESEGVALLHSKKQQLRTIEAYESESAYAEGVWTGASLHEDSYRINAYLVTVLHGLDRTTVPLVDDPALLLTETITKRRALVKLDDTSEILVTSLERIRQKNELDIEIAKHGLTRTLFKAQLNKLQSMFYIENTQDFTEMTNVKILQRIGMLGAMHARKGESYAMTVSSAILDAISKDKPVNISYSIQMPNGTLGHSTRIGFVLDVIMPTSIDDSIEPAVVIDARDDINNNDPVSIPFDRITGFGF